MVRYTYLFLIVVLVFGVTAPGKAKEPIPEKSSPVLDGEMTRALRGGRILMNYDNLDVRVLARLMAELTGKNIILDDRVRGRVTVISTREVTPDEAWDIFRVALERYGFMVRERDGYVQIVPLSEARRTGKVTLNPQWGRSSDIVMAVLLFKKADVNLLQNVVRPLLSEVGVLQPYIPGRALLVVDRAPVVAKIARLTRTIDNAHPEQHVSILFPRYAEATALAPILNKLLMKRRQLPGVERLSIEAFGPSNAIIIHGTKRQILTVKDLVHRLDLPRAAPKQLEEPRFYVYQLQNAKAEDVAKILSEMLAEKAQAQKEVEKAELRNRPGTVPNGSRQGQKPKPDVMSPYATSLHKTGQTKKKVFVSSKVASDPETNSLIFFVSPKEYSELKKLVAYLDLPRKQVLVTAVVAEVSLSALLKRSAAFQAITSGGVLSSFNGGLTSEGLLSFLSSGNFVVGVVGSGTRTVNVGGRDVEVPEFFLQFGAEGTNNDFNLISAPRVMTEDHQEAEINVGNVVPFATGARFDNFGQPLITYDYRDVGIKLTVTPHVSQSDRIRLELKQEVQEVTDFLQQNLGGFGYVVPLISNRDVSTTVTVEDGQTLMIGGLISKRTIETIRKVPILGDIPLLKEIFSETRKEDKKTTLFIALTPHIVDVPSDVARLDKPYKEFLQGHQNLRDSQVERHDTRPSPYTLRNANRHEVPDPYQEGSLGEEVPAEDRVQVVISELHWSSSPRPKSESVPEVEVLNKQDTPVELLLVVTVRNPEGEVVKLEAPPVRIGGGEVKQVELPSYRFGSVGVYEFDLQAFAGDQMVGRLALPQKVKVLKQ